MGLIDSFISAMSFRRCAIPNEEPIRKQAQLLPESLISDIFCARASELSNLPSGVIVQNHEPFGILESIRSASFSRPACMVALDGYSGSLDSGSSIK